MNALELFHKDGGSAGVFYCGECRCVKRTQDEAEQCCKPYTCSKCGVVTEKYWTICNGCRSKKRQEEERARFEAAEKIDADAYEGWLYCDGIAGSNEGFFEDLETLIDLCCDAEVKPEYAWACNPQHFAVLDIDDILQRIEEDGDAYEDFDARDMNGIPELEKALVAFNEANIGVVSYSPDYKRAVLLDWSKIQVEA